MGGAGMQDAISLDLQEAAGFTGQPALPSMGSPSAKRMRSLVRF